MKREIKFRIWDRHNQEYYSPTYESYKGRLHDLNITTSGELCERTLTGFAHESTFEGVYIIEQWTGLQDKNGNDVYHGDKVSSDIQSNGIIDWDETRGTMFINFGGEGWDHNLSYLKKCEVTGTIHDKTPQK